MIPNQFVKTIEIIREFNEVLLSKFGTDLTPEEEATIEYILNPKTSNFWHANIEKTFEKEYCKLNETNKYFIGCKFEVYNNNYKDRLSSFLNEDSDSREQDFIENELKLITSFTPSDYAQEQLQETIKTSLKRQVYFLEDKLFQIGFTAIYDPKSSIFLKTEVTKHTLNAMNLNDEESLKITEKIVYLSELGVLDFLRNKQPFTSSINTLAEILSVILGEKRATLQSYLNPMFSSGVIQSNNPLINNKSLSKVRTHLAEIGFTLKKQQ